MMQKGVMSRLLVFAFAAVLLLPAVAQAQAVIKVNENTSIRFGALIQGWLDSAQSSTASGYSQNIFLRRMRILIGGTLSPTVSFFFQTDNPNLGRAPKALGTGFIVQDAYMEWKPRSNAFMLDAGLILPPFCRDCLGSAGALLSLDYNSWSFIASGPTQSVVGRDTGVQAKGFVMGNHLEYRAAILQGFRSAATSTSVAGHNAFRATGRVQYDVWDTEPNLYVYPEVYFGNKRILALGVGRDHQQGFSATSADAQLSLPVAKNAFNGLLTLYRFDGGRTFTAIPRQRDGALQAGFYFAPTKLMPFARYEQQDFRLRTLNGTDNNRLQLGLGWYPGGNNFNVKAAYTRVEPRVARSTKEYTVQLQFFYY